MNDLDLVRRLRLLRRTVDVLEAKLRHGQLDEKLLAEIDTRLENGIASDARCAGLRARVDALRESTVAPRGGLHTDAVRACGKLKDAIEGVLSGMG